MPGSLVFDPPDHRSTSTTRRTGGPIDRARSGVIPKGPASTLHGRERHPVTHVAPEDAEAYASWAARSCRPRRSGSSRRAVGLEGATFVWGDEFAPKGKMMANTWQGEFPWQNLLTDGFEGTSPVKSFPPNGYGLFDMAGNVWEWTSDYFTTIEGVRACMLRPPEPARELAGSEPGRRSARGADPAEGDQGRIPSVRARTTACGTARSPSERGGRHVDEPHRVPLHRPFRKSRLSQHERGHSMAT